LYECWIIAELNARTITLTSQVWARGIIQKKDTHALGFDFTMPFGLLTAVVKDS